LKSPVITGESAVTALGRTLAETRAALAAGRSAVEEVEDDGAPPAAVAALPGDLLDQLGLTEALGMTRMHGLTAMVGRVKRMAGEFGGASEPSRSTVPA